MSIMGDRLVSSFHHNAGFLLTMFTICLVVGAASGTYPALILSSYQPAQTVHGSFAHGARGAALRKALVFVQFSIAILLLACTGMVRAQMEYVRTKEVGFDKSQLLYVRLRDPDARSQYLLMREEIVQNVAIRGVSAGGGIAGAGGSDGTMIVAGTNKSERTMMRFSPVDYDFFSTLDIPMVQGRDFSRAIASDSSNGVIVNESTLHELGWKDAIGKQFENGGDDKRLTVIGVVKDYHFFSLYMKIEPQLLYIDRTNINDMLVRIRPGQIEQGVALVERIWKQHLPAEPFEYGFVDQAFDQQYRADQNTQKLFGAFSLVAVIVGCLGLFGLSSFTAEQRTKEIGIRKVLGASAASIAARLSVEFVKLVALSCIVAFPVGYWAMQEWLQNFAYRTTISPLTFILAGGIVVVIALVTVSVQSIKVSLANPIEALRYE
jgi:putative ABC transport system permease protein